MKTSFLIPLILGLLAASCTAPTNIGPSTAHSASPTPQATPSQTPSASPTASVDATPSIVPQAAAPFAPAAGVRFGEKDLVAPSYAAFDSQQGLVYAADVLDAGTVTSRYQLIKLSGTGAMLSKSPLAPEARLAPTRVDGVVVNLAALPIVNTMNDANFQLMKVAGATVSAADRYPVNSLPYARLSASASAENGKHVVVVVLHRGPDSNNSGPEFLSLGRSEDDKAPTTLYRVEDPLAQTARLTVAGDGRAFLAGTAKNGTLAVVRVKTDRSVEALAVKLPGMPDVMTVGPDDRLYMAWNGVAGAAKVRSMAQDGQWSAEGEIKLASGEYLTRLSSIAFDSIGRSVVTGTGFDAVGKSMKAAFLYSK